MSQYASLLAAGGATCVNFLNRILIGGYTDYVFEYLVMQYKLKPTKKKAIALYEVFCAEDAPMRLNADDVLPPRDDRISREIGIYIASRAAAQQMGMFARISSSGSREPSKTVFDFILPQAFRQEDSAVMNPLKNASGTAPALPSKSDAQYRILVSVWKPSRAKLIEAGFDKLKCTVQG